MDYEKKYKEALEEAKKIHNETEFDYEKGMMEEIFPELKESEDERIKKDLIGFFKDGEFLYHKKEEIVEWLEKQGEKPQGKTYTFEGKSVLEAIDNINKVEPKFKVGEWITDDEAVFHITSYSIDYGYQLETPKGTSFHFSNENVEIKYHLWTIQDAKDGDVLVVPPIKGSEHSEQIFIFKEIKDREYVKNAIEYYCRCVDNEFNTNERGFMGQSDDYFTPATKEQRDLLFQKMKEAGYEWDDEHKRLLSLPLKDTKRKDMSQQIKLKEPDVYEYELERIVDKLNEVIGKLGDIHEVLSKPYVFPYRDYTSPNSIPGMDVWYKTHGVERVTPVTCETLNSIETDNGKEIDKERTN